MNRLRVVMAGPLPPAIGGMATVIDELSHSELTREVDLVLVDTKKQTREGRTLREAVAARLHLWRTWWQALGGGDTVAHIHTCSGLSYFLDGTLLALARLRRVPVVLHVHGGFFDRFLDGLSAPWSTVARVLANNAAAVIVLSDEWRTRLAPRLPGARLRVIRNAVAEPPDFESEKRDRLTILFLGGLTTAKGVRELVTAMAAVPPGARLVLVGEEHEAGIIAQLQEEAAKLGLADRVVFAGAAYGEAKHRWLAEADIFVLPSHAEGLPMSLLEAMAAGLPVVVTPVGGVPSVVTHEEHGLFIPLRDHSALAAALRRLVEDPALRARLAEAGRRRCRAEFGMERAVREYLTLYHSVVGGAV